MNLVLNLSESEKNGLYAKAAAEGISVEEYTHGLINRDLTIKTNEELFQAIYDIWKDVPEEIWASMPADGASEHDHYLYGTPKKNQQ